MGKPLQIRKQLKVWRMKPGRRKGLASFLIFGNMEL
jgi:hypothetical protein